MIVSLILTIRFRRAGRIFAQLQQTLDGTCIVQWPILHLKVYMKISLFIEQLISNLNTFDRALGFDESVSGVERRSVCFTPGRKSRGPNRPSIFDVPAGSALDIIHVRSFVCDKNYPNRLNWNWKLCTSFNYTGIKTWNKKNGKLANLMMELVHFRFGPETEKSDPISISELRATKLIFVTGYDMHLMAWCLTTSWKGMFDWWFTRDTTMPF